MNKEGLVNIVIPVYRDNITYEEKISLQQCIKILSEHPIILVSHRELNLSIYFNEYPDFGVEYFDIAYFKDVRSYNELMLSRGFYERFINYKYILIYQLDAFVFRDELNYWCTQEYDYIGAPWFDNFGSYKNGNELWSVGNGGFSLRNVKSFLKILNYRGPVKKPSVFLKELNIKSQRNIIKKLVLFFLMCFGYRNNISYFLNRFNQNEDFFWEQFLKGGFITLKMPSPEIAAYFSFEKSPEYLFSKIGEKLPFGCHAWEKNLNFWNQYILEKT